MQPAKKGMSTGKKVVIVLAGAALLYYLYKHHEKAKEMAQGQDVQYYQSKNGRIYYRDPKTHQVHWVTFRRRKFPTTKRRIYSATRAITTVRRAKITPEPPKIRVPNRSSSALRHTDCKKES